MALMCHPHFAGTARPSKGSGKRRNPFGAELFRVRPLRLGRDRTGGRWSSSRPSGRGGSQDARGLIHGALAAKQARILWAWWVTGRPYQPAAGTAVAKTRRSLARTTDCEAQPLRA